MTPVDPGRARVILATDCGSTTTKAILIQQVDGVYRQTHRGEAPTTVEAPFADVTIGVVNAVTEVQELAGRRLIGDDGRIIHPATEHEGCDLYISTSSAGGGLQMMVAGVVREMTGESAKRDERDRIGVQKSGERVHEKPRGAFAARLRELSVSQGASERRCAVRPNARRPAPT